MHILYYVTSHGYGHGVRTVAIANALSPACGITFRTSLPEQFFREEIRRQFVYAPAEYDCGCIQHDSVRVAYEETLAAYRAIARRNKTMLADEVRWVRERRADIIVSDITPFAFEVGHHAGIPSVAVTNFTWHDIYEPYVRDLPDYQPELDKIRSQYEMADELLALEPGALPMSYFGKRRSIPPVGRIGRDRRVEIASRYDLDPASHFALIYFGHFGIDGIDWRRLSEFTDWQFLGICPLPDAPPNYRFIDKSDFPYQDLAASVDCMICKIGYGSVSECMLHGTPVIYLPRENFAEFPALDAAVRAWGGGYPLSTDAFLSLRWEESLSDIVRRGRLPRVSDEGARVCAQAIEDL